MSKPSDDAQHRQSAVLTGLLTTMRILWRVARLIQREHLYKQIEQAAEALKAATEPPRL
ncbi:MAG: hypothetical protein HC857_16635 [Synechococcales cyanobacterium RU_4_20]|nr:hypothetical protein [Synechococcales cyanobacterium RU_4_20]NJR70513.1 hypothetical protein [Synechococcales cyanobacterium CRU_2_2]